MVVMTSPFYILLMSMVQTHGQNTALSRNYEHHLRIRFELEDAFPDVPNEHKWRYDSSKLWADPDTCSWPSNPPKRPTELFESVTGNVCSTSPQACELFERTFVDPWDNAVTWLPDGTVYVITGDIPLMWLRDSVSQVMPYLYYAEHPAIQRLIEGLLRRAMVWIEMDPYGSAFRMELDFNHKNKRRLTQWDFECGRTVHVAQHDYEIDSLAYVVRLAYLYWKATNRTCWMGTHLSSTFERIIDLWVAEQQHETSPYTYPTLKNDGKGSKTCYTGMTWGGMRPSDDSMTYHYNIPANMFAAVALGYMIEMAHALWPSSLWISKAEQLQYDIHQGIQAFGIVDGKYAYEVDGCGNSLLADDANIPSLLSVPYIKFPADEQVYNTTRRFILSTNNPWYFEGSVISGIGSPHTGYGKVWHLGLVMEALTNPDSSERVLNTVLKTSDRGLHESIGTNGDGKTREWFGWANALFSEWMIQVSKEALQGLESIGVQWEK